LHYIIIGALKNSKTSRVPYVLRPSSVNFCRNFFNLSHETVLLSLHLCILMAYKLVNDGLTKWRNAELMNGKFEMLNGNRMTCQCGLILIFVFVFFATPAEHINIFCFYRCTFFAYKNWVKSFSRYSVIDAIVHKFNLYPKDLPHFGTWILKSVKDTLILTFFSGKLIVCSISCMKFKITIWSKSVYFLVI
jgi:hypothetical protein